MQERKRNKIGVLVMGALAVMTQAHAVRADDAPAAKLEKIEVTGSMVQRANAETSEAITVIKMDALKAQGFNSIEQVLSQVVANQSLTTASSSISAYTGGGSFASLRGLGASKTLVLLDGQRLANNVQLGSAVDLAGIPFGAIEQIEILREGASSLYGSDAIAGVINFITRKNSTGGEVALTVSQPQKSGGSAGGLELTYGHGKLAEDGYNVLVAASYGKSNELQASQRSFSYPGFNAAKGALQTNGIATFPGSYIDGNGNQYQVNYPACPGNPLLTTYYGNCAYEYGGATDLLPAATTSSGLIALSKALGADHTVSAQYFYTESKVVAYGGPISYGFNMTPADNPAYFPTAATSTFVGSGTPAAPNLSGPITAYWTDPNNYRYQGDTNTEQRILLTLKGSDYDWDYSVNYDYSRNHNDFQVLGGYPDFSKLVNANGNLSNLINPFGPLSAAGQALINSAYTNGSLSAGDLSLSSFNAHASHALGDWLHAGDDVALGLGFDVRHEAISNNPTQLASTLYAATGYPPSSIGGSRDSTAVFAELNVPITKKLEVTISDRQDHYSDFGDTNNGKLAFRYQPSSIATLRGATSTGFRAPSLVDLFSPQTLGATAGAMNGPGCASGNYNTVFTSLNCVNQGLSVSGGNPKLEPEKSRNLDLGIVLSPVENLGITIDYYKIKLKNTVGNIPSAAIYANPGTFANLYSLNNAGTLTTAPALAAQCANGPSTPTCGYILQSLQNTGQINTQGFDYSIEYLLNSSVGKWKFGLEATSVSSFDLQQYKGSPFISLTGGINQGNQPVLRWSSTLNIDWSRGDWGAGVTNHYVSSYLDQNPNPTAAPINTVAGYSIWTLYGTWKPVKSVTLLAGVRNVFNTEPPFSNQSLTFQQGYNPYFVDPTMRAFYAKAKYEF